MHVGMTRCCRQWFSSPDKLAGGLSKIVMAESAPRFASVSEADLGRLVDDKDAKNTKRATKTALRVLQQYLKEKKAFGTIAGLTFQPREKCRKPWRQSAR